MRALILVLMLAGCASKPPVALVPVSQPCVSGELPAEPAKVGPELTGDAGRDAGIIAGSAAELRAWGRALYRMLDACR
jgi:hypothetical protein